MTNNNTNTVYHISLSTIRTSTYNPRKTFGDSDLNELSESIKVQGVLQPIMLRPLSANTFEIVYGERRFKASQLAGIETIPAIIKELSDTQAIECAITENLQRKEVSPMEELMAYKQLMENSGYDVKLLMTRFGKSESYIRSRMRLNSLIGEFAELVLSDELNLITALEICKYSIETQSEIFEQHYETDNHYQNWTDKKAKEVIEMIERNYSSTLDDYFFDKSACFDCQFNSQTHSLFASANSCGKCLHFTCMKRKNIDYIVQRAMETHEHNPELPLARAEYYYSEEATQILADKDYDIEVVNFTRTCPQPPIIPIADDFETKEEYYQAEADYEESYMEFEEQNAHLYEKYEKGEVKMYALIGERGVSLSYISTLREHNFSSNGKEMETPLIKLEKQDARNIEIAREKIIADVKALVQDTDFTKNEFTALEERIVYFAMLKNLRRDHFGVMGVETDSMYYISDDDRLRMVANLTENTKNIIRRDFILATLKDAFRNDATADLLLDFANQHVPDDVITIKEKHDEVLNKRHQRIMDKMDAMTTQVVEED